MFASPRSASGRLEEAKVMPSQLGAGDAAVTVEPLRVLRQWLN
jgi:hypothetical protein